MNACQTKSSCLKSSLQTTFQGPKDYLLFVVLSFALFALFVLIPVYTTPGNDLQFQLHITSWQTFALMIALSCTNALLLCMQRKIRELNAKKPSVVKQTATVFGIATTAIASTLACASCYSSVLAVFGLGGSIFIVTNRWWFAATAIALTLFAIHATAKRMAGQCTTCAVPFTPTQSEVRNENTTSYSA